MIRKFGASGIDFQPKGLDLGLGSGVIKTIQTGESTIAASSTFANVAIASVDITKSIVLITYSTAGAGLYVQYAQTSGYLSGATSLRLERYSSDANIINVSWQVIEFTSAVKVQMGAIGASFMSTTATVTAVNLSKAIVFINYNCNNASYTQYASVQLLAKLTSTTVLTVKNTYSTMVYNVNWYVVELP
jgi:hypothetical protein